MRKRKFLAIASAAIISVCVAALGIAANGSSQFAGVWTGTWEGGGTGRFDITLTSDGGSVSVGTDGGDYTAKFTALAIAGNKINAKYNYPPDEQGEITLTGTFDGNKASGTWSLGQKGQEGPAVANGTWTVTKK